MHVFRLVNTSNSNNYWASQQNDMLGMGAAAPAYSQNNHMYGGGHPSSSSTAMPAYNDPFSSNVQHYVRISLIISSCYNCYISFTQYIK